MRPRTNSILKVIAGLALVIGMGLSTAAAEARSYYLDAYDKGKDSYAGPKKTAKLKKGVPYVMTVRGTFSFFGSRDLRADFCGKPEKRPIFKSKKRKNGYVAGDAEWLFADLKGNCDRRGGALTVTGFEVRTNRKWSNPTPIGGQPEGPSANHGYRYPLIGAGKKVRVRLFDSLTKDNYGRLRIRYRPAKARDCAGLGFTSWFYPNVDSCVAATQGVSATTTPAPTPTPTPSPTAVPAG